MSEQEPDPVVVVGDLMLDEAWFGRRDRVCPDAASPVFRVQRRESALGGAARVAKVLVDLGVPVEVVGVIGDDLAGRELLGLLQEHGIGVDGVVVDAHRPTTMKRSHFEGTHARANTKVFRVDLESQDPLPLKLRAKLEQHIVRVRNIASVVVVSDYGKGVVDESLVRSCQGAAEVLVDPSRLASPKRYAGADLISPNRDEAIHLTGQSASEPIRLAHAVSECTGVAHTVVTLDVEGAVLVDPDGASSFPTVPVKVTDAAGAGDAFIAGIAAERRQGKSWEECVQAANHTAAQHISQPTSNVLVELKSNRPDRVDSRDHLLQSLAQWKALGRRVVLTNGCFDLLHAGHVSLLTEAARLGDVLVVGLNTDESVRQLKGPDRPVRHWEDRSSLLAALECVDVVVPLFESTAHELIREVRPDVYVKGGDYRRDELVEIDLLDELKIPVHLASLVPGVCTSGLARRLRGQA
ncbi:MAG: hypothetical protein CBD11_01315 [Phycisphaera sp. TMED151]|jgi:D-beta-D-heptose 7-phosphate kinase/D-beta-D-heptose 1-phosphate adenosyltransferase|nr:MAG: hypothetical protein CBD11_01315 [Phycisphaera sp. TMED151]